MTKDEFKNYERCWAEIDLSDIAHNMKEIKSHLSEGVLAMAIIKADAYGHGAIPLSHVLLKSGADCFGVATCGEAIELRKGGIEAPILLLAYTPPGCLKDVVENGLTQTIFSIENAKELDKCAGELNKKAKVHLKIDTGMGRVGFLPVAESVEEIKQICGLKNLDVEGIFMHFAKSDSSDLSFTVEQNEKFTQFIKLLEKEGINFKIKHASNSGGIIAAKEYNFNLVRAGIILYGLPPSGEVSLDEWNLKRALSWKTQISYVKEVEEGVSVGYGRNFFAKRKSKIATLPIGYADGFSRSLSNKGKVLVCGEYAPIVGNVCMDQSMIDVTDIKGVKQGDEVVLIGSQNGKSITADDMACVENTINYEIVCAISKRVPRKYINNV